MAAVDKIKKKRKPEDFIGTATGHLTQISAVEHGCSKPTVWAIQFTAELPIFCSGHLSAAKIKE